MAGVGRNEDFGIQRLSQRAVQGVECSTACLGGVLFGESGRGLEGAAVDNVYGDQFPGSEVIGDQLQSSLRLVPGGFPAKDLEFERRGKLEVVQRGVSKRLARDLGRDQGAVLLGVVEFDQTTGVEVDHNSSPAAGDQFAQSFAGRLLPPNQTGSGQKIRLARRRGNRALANPAPLEPGGQLIYFPLRQANNGFLYFD